MTYMSTAERIVKLHDKMCDNIEAMGGTVDPTKTLIEIADAILDIPPVPVGVSIDTATTCSADKSTTTVSSPVTFTGKVSAYHDDETAANVDLIGYLKGATVKFYNGQTLLGSAITDNNGEYSFSYTPSVAGEMSVIAMFEAVEDYKQSSSTAVVITVSSYSDIVMSADKSILSYADNEKATLYAQLVDENDTPLAIGGVTLTFKKDSTILGTVDTDSTGLATLVDGYTSQGVGDVTLSVTDGMFLIQTYSISDCEYFDASSSAKVSRYTTNGNSISYDSTEQAYLITHQSANTTRGILLNDVTFTNKVKITAKLKYIATVSNNQCGIGLYDGSSMAVIGKPIFAPASNYWGMSISSNDLTSYGTDNGLVNLTSSDFNTNDWYTLELIINENNITFNLYKADTLVNTSTASLSVLNATGNKLAIQTAHSNNIRIYLKDIMVKPL